MPIPTWLFLGLAAGMIGGRIVPAIARGALGDTGASIAGALVDGAILASSGAPSATGLAAWSPLVLVASVLALLAARALRSRAIAAPAARKLAFHPGRAPSVELPHPRAHLC